LSHSDEDLPDGGAEKHRRADSPTAGTSRRTVDERARRAHRTPSLEQLGRVVDVLDRRAGQELRVVLNEVGPAFSD
jgi:hypothetical protein